MTDAREPGTRLVVIRHGESNATVGRFVSSADTCTGLSDLGRRQADALRERLATTGELPTDGLALYASHFARAIETAEIIAPALGVDVKIEPGFGEQYPGTDCDGMTFDAFVEKYGRPDWETNPYAVSFPGGESVAEFDLRVGTTLSDVLDRHAGGTVVVSCHGGVVDRVLRQLLRTSKSGIFELFTRNTSLTEFVEAGPGKWRLVRYNDAAHLAGLPPYTPWHTPDPG